MHYKHLKINKLVSSWTVAVSSRTFSDFGSANYKEYMQMLTHWGCHPKQQQLMINCCETNTYDITDIKCNSDIFNKLFYPKCSNKHQHADMSATVDFHFSAKREADRVLAVNSKSTWQPSVPIKCIQPTPAFSI